MQRLEVLDEFEAAPVITCEAGGYSSFCHASQRKSNEVEKMIISTSFFVSIIYLIRLVFFDKTACVRCVSVDRAIGYFVVFSFMPELRCRKFFRYKVVNFLYEMAEINT